MEMLALVCFSAGLTITSFQIAKLPGRNWIWCICGLLLIGVAQWIMKR